MTQTVLILGGNGKIGSHAADAFWNAGWSVRHYTRGTDMTQAAMGADVIINGLNPPNYHDWSRNIPAITSQVIAAAKASGATMIIPGNIYNYGNQPGVLDETTPQTPNTHKGKIRVEMEQAYEAAGVPTIILRAGNFIDPHHNSDLMSLVMMRGVRKGQITAMGDPTSILAYAYLPDWAQAALMLAEKRSEFSTFEDIPFPGHAFSAAQLRDEIEAFTKCAIRVTTFPWWLMSALSPVWELAREMREMRYLYTMPHQIGADKFNRILPDFHPTDLTTVMRAGLPADIHPNKVMRSSGHAVAAE